MAKWLIPSLADLVFAALLAFVVGLRSRHLLNSDGDLARHLAVGLRILEEGAVPTADYFSYTRYGEPFVAKEWLGQAILALVYQRSGLEGVALFAAVLVALPFLLLTRWMLRDGATFFVVLALVTAGILSSTFHWLARPHLFTILMALLWTRSLVLHRRTGALRWLLPLPPLMLLWVNLHGGFLMGFALLAVFLAAEVVDPRGGRRPAPLHSLLVSVVSSSRAALAAAGLVCLLAVGINPAGYGVLAHVLGFLQSRLLVDRLAEWASPDFHQFGFQLFLGLVLLAMVSLAANSRRVDAADLGLLLVWIFFSLSSMRNIPIFVMVCLPTVARLATGALEALPATRLAGGVLQLSSRLGAADRTLGRPLVPILCVAAATLAFLGPGGDPRPRALFEPSVFPVEAVARAEAVGARGNLFNAFTWGGYVVYAASPRHRVFIDGQVDFYGEELTRDYLRVARLEPEWEAVLDRYEVGWVLFPHLSPLSQLLGRTPGWRLAYQDDTADILIRVRDGGS